MELTGCGTALVTPFAASGGGEPPIDEAALRSLVEWQIASGIDFLVACGTTAETPTLNDEEWLRVIQIVAETAGGRVPVWAGCTHNATREAVAKARTAAQVPGVTAILSANPYYNRPTQEGQFQHFKAVAEAVELPVVLYNIPGRTGANLEPSTVARLVEAAPNIEASQGVERTARADHGARSFTAGESQGICRRRSGCASGHLGRWSGVDLSGLKSDSIGDVADGACGAQQ